MILVQNITIILKNNNLIIRYYYTTKGKNSLKWFRRDLRDNVVGIYRETQYYVLCQTNNYWKIETNLKKSKYVHCKCSNPTLGFLHGVKGPLYSVNLYPLQATISRDQRLPVCE